MGIKERIVRDFYVWFIGGMVYFYFEILFRGFSHYSMIICGGFCVLLVGYLGRYFVEHCKKTIEAVVLIMIFGSVVITSLEFVTGYVVNIRFGNCVWDYSSRKNNVLGQICLEYSVLWSGLSLICVAIDDIVRRVMDKW